MGFGGDNDTLPPREGLTGVSRPEKASLLPNGFSSVHVAAFSVPADLTSKYPGIERHVLKMPAAGTTLGGRRPLADLSEILPELSR
jgi:hypothetical protein